MKYTPSKKPTKKQLDKLWAKAVKLRAGNQSEYKIIEGSPLHSHHILGKSTLVLRYNLDNGVCVTGGQHFYVAHHTGRASDFKTWALNKRGVTEEYLKITSRNKIDMWALELFLQEMIEQYKLQLKSLL